MKKCAKVPPTSTRPKFEIGLRVMTLRKEQPGTIIARFKELRNWSYVVHMDERYESSIYGNGANRAVFGEHFLLPETDLSFQGSTMPGGTKRSKRSA